MANYLWPPHEQKRTHTHTKTNKISQQTEGTVSSSKDTKVFRILSTLT